MSFLTDIFGKTKVSAPQIPVSTFSGGGLNSSFSNGVASVTPDANRSATVGGQVQNYSDMGTAYGDLLSTVAPGYNDLLKSRLTSFNNDASSAIGTLGQNLQSRRVLGSSFGADTITRAQNQFAQQKDSIVADNYLKSLQASTDLVGKKYGAYNGGYTSALNELNLEGGAAQDLMKGASATLGQNAQLQASADQFNAKMSNDQASGLGSFLGKVALAPMTGGMSLTIPGGLPGGSPTA